MNVLFFRIDNAWVQNAVWLPNSQLQITVQVSGSGFPEPKPEALGHFTFGDDQGHYYRFLQNPVFVNTHDCEYRGYNETNPFTITYSYDPAQTPPKGTKVGIWVAIYWNCDTRTFSAINCCSQNVYYSSTV